MTVGICIIAHSPLASALKTCCRHIYSATNDTAADNIVVYDVPSDIDFETGIAEARSLVAPLLETREGVLVFTDLLGATPGNIAQKLLEEPRVALVAGVNLPGVVTALNVEADAPLNRVMLLAEGGVHSAVSTAIGRAE